MAEFAEVEAVDGVRMTWNVWPGTRVEASKCVVPLATLFTPLHPVQNLAAVPYAPLRCKSCRSLLNPFSQVDFVAKIWICPFCYQRNHFPPHYASISENNLPAELFPQYTTIEYMLPGETSQPPIFLFLLDTCLIEEELVYLKTALSQAVGLVPANSLVGLITYGTQVHVHELGFSECPKSYVFRGSKDVTKEQILDQLGLTNPGGAQRGAAQPVGVIAGVRDGISASSINRFLLPAADCEFTLTTLLDELQRDSFPVKSDQRAARCTGTALSVAAGLLGACVPGTGARILAFVGGPCTEGSGTIVSKDLTEPIRSHKDLDKDTVPQYHKAVKFYEALAKQLVNQGHVLDLFACALDQVGVAEMKVAVERTGGLVVLAESFGHSVFKDSFRRVFEAGEHALGLSFNGIFEVNCSKDVRIQGTIGPCASLEKKWATDRFLTEVSGQYFDVQIYAHVPDLMCCLSVSRYWPSGSQKGVSCAETVVGQGNTSAWKMCGLDRSTTLAVFFEIVPSVQSSATPAQPISQQFFIQFLTHYQHVDGNMRLRATTVRRRWVDGSASTEELVAGFDQETAAVVMGRLCSYKMETEDEFDATRWLDRSLIRLSSRFGDYRKDDPSSFSFSQRFAIFPQFMFNLRRSQYVQVFNNSPDETAYFRMVLNRENVTNSLVMIQPSLISYSFNAPPEPALLDVAAIAADRILLLDAYFSVVIFHGMTIAQWRNAGFQNQPEHQAFAQLLQMPKEDAQAIIKDRFPVPRLVDCDQHGSQARFLLAKLNPSATYNSANGPAPGGDIIFTDDVSLQVFVEHLQRLAVSS